MKERLQKLIAAAGLCSRRTAEEWIVQGKVTVNGGLARLGDTADPETDEIRVDGRPLPAAPRKTTTVLLYKPRGVVTTMHDEKGRPGVAELLPPELGRLYPVGRLDQFSEGLLLMTNDGELANRLTHPKGEVRKTYRLWVSGWHEGALEQLRRPIVLDGYRIKPPEVRLLWERIGNRQQAIGNRGREDAPVGAAIGRPQTAESFPVCHPERSEGSASPVPSLPLEGKVPPQGADEVVSRQETATDEALRASYPTSSVTASPRHLPLEGKAYEGAPRDNVAALEITIHEGRNRQIRRMAEAAGLKTTRLKRIAEGSLRLGDLKPGQWRRLTETELEQLKLKHE